MSRGRPIDAIPIIFIASIVLRLALTASPTDAYMTQLPVAATAPFPAAAFWIAAGALGFPLMLAALWSAFLRRRFWPIIAFHVLGATLVLVQLFLTSDLKLRRVSPEASAKISMTVVATRLGALAEEGRLPEDRELLERTLAGLPPHGETRRRWIIDTARCSSAEELPSSLPLGVVLYCLSSDRSSAWLAWNGGDGRPPADGQTNEEVVEPAGHAVDHGRLRWLAVPNLD